MARSATPSEARGSCIRSSTEQVATTRRERWWVVRRMSSSLFDLSSPSDLLSPALSPCLSFSLSRIGWPSPPPPRPPHRTRGRRGGLGTKDVQDGGAILQRDGRSTERVGEKRGPHTAAREQRYNDARSLPPRQCVPPRRPVISLALPLLTGALSSCPGHFLIPRTLRQCLLLL